MADIKFEIMEHITKISESASGWTRELNLVSWNGAAPKFDLRDWSPDHTKMSKGLTMTADELSQLKAALAEMEL